MGVDFLNPNKIGQSEEMTDFLENTEVLTNCLELQ